MAYQITAEDIALLLQIQKNVSVSIEICNKNMQVIDSIEGIVIDDGYSVDVNSDVRRVYNVTLLVKNRKTGIGEFKQIWVDKLLKVQIGVENIRTGNIHWYPLGTYAFNGAASAYDAASSTLQLSCADMVCLLNGELNGQLAGYENKIPAGTKIREAMVSTVTQLGGFSRFRIEDMEKEVPYDLEFSTGATVWDIISDLKNLYGGWETFFDVDGTFICQPVPTCETDPVEIDNSILSPLVISESTQEDIASIRNVTKVFGSCLNADYYTETVSSDGSTYNITVNNVKLKDNKIPGGTKFAFKCDADNKANARVKINSLGTFPIYDENGKMLAAGRLSGGKSYVFRYRSDKLTLMGQWQIAAVAKEVDIMPTEEEIEADKIKEACDNIRYAVNPQSSYCISKIGRRLQVLSGGNYNKITSEQLALERAEYENWLKTRLSSSISLQLLAVPWISGNEKVEYTVKQSGETKQYIVKRISGSTKSWIQNWEMIQFFPDYPFVVSDWADLKK